MLRPTAHAEYILNCLFRVCGSGLLGVRNVDVIELLSPFIPSLSKVIRLIAPTPLPKPYADSFFCVNILELAGREMITKTEKRAYTRNVKVRGIIAI
jgi:hypothetical protein